MPRLLEVESCSALKQGPCYVSTNHAFGQPQLDGDARSVHAVNLVQYKRLLALRGHGCDQTLQMVDGFLARHPPLRRQPVGKLRKERLIHAAIVDAVATLPVDRDVGR